MPRAFAWLALVLWLAACGAEPTRPNVVIVVFDTTRADHVSAYGYPEPTTPHFDAFAKRAIFFEQAFATSSWTLPSHASLFTGLYPMTHGATQENEYLGDTFETLAELLGERGYETVAFSSNAWVGARTNLVQGFEHVAEIWRQRGIGKAARTNREIETWLDVRGRERPFFLFVNYIEPHWTYDAPRKARERFVSPGVTSDERRRANFRVVDWYLDRSSIPQALLPLRRQLYDAEVATVDQALGGLLAMLREHGFEENSLVVVVSDHGENLGDHGHQGHSFSLYDSTLHVPLAIRPPGGAGAGTRRSEPVQLTDVFATVAAATGLASRGVGADLLDATLPADRAIVGEYYYPNQFLAYFPEDAREGPLLAAYRRRIRSLRSGRHKLIWGSDGRNELYDVEQDPGETRDLAAQRPELVRRLEDRLLALVQAQEAEHPGPPGGGGPLDPETEESLRELGYLR